MSLASVLVMSANRRRLAPSVAASALAAVSRIFASGSMQLAEQRLERQALAFEVEPQRRHRVVEQPVPGGGRAHRFVEEQALELVGELMRLLLADVLEPGAIMPERRRAHRRLKLRIVEAIEFELEKQEIAGERGHPFLRVAVEFRPRRIAGVGGVEQRRIGHDAAGQILQRLVRLDRRGQCLARVRPVREMRRACRDRLRRRASPPARRVRDRRRSGESPCPSYRSSRRHSGNAPRSGGRGRRHSGFGRRSDWGEWNFELINQASALGCR